MSKRLQVAGRRSLFLCLAACAIATACDDEPASSSQACVYNSDCQANEICAGGTCRPECQASRDCPEGQSCIRGVCTLPGRPDGGQPGDGGSDTDDGDSGGVSDLPDFGPRPVGFGTVEGIVHFRLHDGSMLPVATPVVYWTYPESPPEPFVDGISCDCGFPAEATRGGVNGRFVLEDVPAGWVYLVVQKGRFRRYRLVEVPADETLYAPLELTQLPVRDDPDNGDEIPSIAIGTGRFDAIEDIFAKIGMGPITPTFGFDYFEYMDDPEAWGVELMLYDQPRELDDEDLALEAPSFLDLLSDDEALIGYDFVFAPCGHYDDYAALMTSEVNRRRLQDYVNEGGKLYVTDYAYDVLEQPFPAYIDFAAPEGADGNADGHIGDPDYMSIAAIGTLQYDSQNRALDPNLARWLEAIEASSTGLVHTTGNWVNLNGVGTVNVCCNEDGDAVDVTPDVVMSGPNGVEPFMGNFGPSHATWQEAEAEDANHPHTVRFPYGCGEVMYSTYHTVDWQQRAAYLQSQELVLLYLILEINQCNPNPIKE